MINIDHIEEEQVQIVMVTGDVDASSSIHLDKALGQAIENNKHIIVDLTGLEYVSSAGLGVFMSYLKEVQTRNLKLILAGLSEKVFHVFEILGLDQLLEITQTVADAKKELNAV